MLAFLDTNMLVFPTQNYGIGTLSQREDPTRMVLHHSGIYCKVRNFRAVHIFAHFSQGFRCAKI